MSVLKYWNGSSWQVAFVSAQGTIGASGNQGQTGIQGQTGLQGISGTIYTTSTQLLNDISDETGTGSLVFGTSPTIATPVIDSPQASSVSSTTTTNPYSNVTTGYIRLGTGLTSGRVNIAEGTTFAGRVDIAAASTSAHTVAISTGAGTTNKTIDIGTLRTGGTTAITLGSSSGATSTITLNGTTLSGGDFVSTSGLTYVLQPTPTNLNVTTNPITFAQIVTGIMTGTPTGAITWTLPTGTLMDTNDSASNPNNGSFDWYVINLSATAGATITIAAGTAHTVVGNMVVAISSSGHFRSRKTASNTWVTYRIS